MKARHEIAKERKRQRKKAHRKTDYKNSKIGDSY